jgi:hypothetical protein
MVHQIRIKDHLGREWADWFEGLTLTLSDNGEMLLTGPVVDQAALDGLRRSVRDGGMPLHAARLRETRPGRGKNPSMQRITLVQKSRRTEITFLLPNYHGAMTLFMGWGELLLMFWLLWRGMKGFDKRRFPGALVPLGG